MEFDALPFLNEELREFLKTVLTIYIFVVPTRNLNLLKPGDFFTQTTSHGRPLKDAIHSTDSLVLLMSPYLHTKLILPDKKLQSGK